MKVRECTGEREKGMEVKKKNRKGKRSEEEEGERFKKRKGWSYRRNNETLKLKTI